MKPLIIYDGRCSFCKIWIDYWQQLTGDAVRYAASQDVGQEHPEISSEEFKRSVWLVLPTGERFRGAEAVFRLMAFVPDKGWPLWLYRTVPGFAGATEAAYRFVAGHRNLFYWITRVLWGKKVLPESYRLSRALFLRSLAAVYFIAFLSLAPQISGLIGVDGIQPVGQYLDSIRQQLGIERYWLLPTLAWFASTNAFLQLLCWTGIAVSAALFAGIAPLPALAVLWLLYLSIVNAGQEFLLFQWDALLLEVGFAALLLAPRGIRPEYASEPPAAARWLMRLLIFRLMLESGLVKWLSGDPTWRSLTALNYHFETQPLPTVLAWYAQHLSATVHKALVAGVFVIEIAVPFLFLMPRRFRLIGAWITVLLQLCIAATGNYGFFNLLTIALCIPLLDDRHLRFRSTGPIEPEQAARPRSFLKGATVFVAFVLIGIGMVQLSSTMLSVRSAPQPLAWLDQHAEMWHVVNHYGLFAVMTTSRPEIVIEGSEDGREWKAYEFKYKPGDVQRPPQWAAPHQPRLDWQMWFAALSDYQNNPWFTQFMLRLLEGSGDVLGLLKYNPFPGQPPKFLRAVIYEYHFSDGATRRATGAWWQRTEAGVYFPPVSLTR